jgi:hypothetical protein
VSRINSTKRVKDRKEPEAMEIVRKILVAATFEKAKTYIFAELVIHNPKVGSSSLPPATSKINYLQQALMRQNPHL